MEKDVYKRQVKAAVDAGAAAAERVGEVKSCLLYTSRCV